jgi:hypothetical protein
MNRKRLSNRRRHKLCRNVHKNTRTEQAWQTIDKVIQICSTLLIGALTIFIGIQSNKISQISIDMQKEANATSSNANEINKISLELSKQSLEQMKASNTLANKSVTISNESVRKMDEANSISSQQFDLSKKMSQPQFSLRVDNNGIITKYSISSENTGLKNIKVFTIRNRIISISKGIKYSHLNFPYYSYNIRNNITKASGSGEICEISIPNEYEKDMINECNDLEKKLKNDFIGAYVYLYDDMVIKVVYQNPLNEEAFVFIRIHSNNMEQVAPKELSIEILDALSHDGFIKYPYDELGKRINEKITSLLL